MVWEPTTLYAYWQMPDSRLLAGQGAERRLKLRLHDVSNVDLRGTGALRHLDYECDPGAGHGYLPEAIPGRSYCVELGYFDQAQWHGLYRSNIVQTPPAGQSAWVEDHFITIAWETDLTELVDLPEIPLHAPQDRPQATAAWLPPRPLPGAETETTRAAQQAGSAMAPVDRPGMAWTEQARDEPSKRVGSDDSLSPIGEAQTGRDHGLSAGLSPLRARTREAATPSPDRNGALSRARASAAARRYQRAQLQPPQVRRPRSLGISSAQLSSARRLSDH